jgi:quinol monooxygenase YgiN
MILERSEVEVAAGQEEAFLRYLQSTRRQVENLTGCRSYTFGRGVENQSRFILLLTWDSVEAHETATQSPEMIAMQPQFAKYAIGGAMEHFVVA